MPAPFFTSTRERETMTECPICGDLTNMSAGQLCQCCYGDMIAEEEKREKKNREQNWPEHRVMMQHRRGNR